MIRKAFSLITIAGLCLVLNVAFAQDTPDATIELTAGSVAAGIGFSWGDGVMTYQGQEYPFSVSGLSVGKVGITNATASGKVFHLSKIEDFNGNYTAAGAGVTVAGGGTAVTMKNQNGVVIDLVSTTQGIDFTFGAGGAKLELK
jgi:hypothetical protein